MNRRSKGAAAGGRTWKPRRRVAIVFDGKAWFLRRVHIIEFDMERGHKVYRCDQHLGGPFATEMDAIAALRSGARARNLAERRKPASSLGGAPR